MTRSRPPSPDVRALLDQERVVPPVPASVRARSLSRARAALVAGRVTPPAGFSTAPRSRRGIALAAAGVATVAIAAAAYELGARQHPEAVDHPAVSTTHVVTPAPVQPVQASAPSTAVVPSSSPAPASRTVRSSATEPSQDELVLLRQARAAVARQDFAAALGPISEHARQFKSGRLAEEREALRVKALSGLGRAEEARRAADAFEARFPRSVLLPAVSKMRGSGP